MIKSDCLPGGGSQPLVRVSGAPQSRYGPTSVSLDSRAYADDIALPLPRSNITPENCLANKTSHTFLRFSHRQAFSQTSIGPSSPSFNDSQPASAPAELPVMAVKAVIPFLVAMMLLTGVCNTLLTKYQVRTREEIELWSTWMPRCSRATAN